MTGSLATKRAGNQAAAIGRRLARPAGLAAIAAFFAVTLVWPLGLIVSRSVGSPPFQPYLNDVTDELFRTVLVRTFSLAAAVTLLCLLIAYPAAYALLRLSKRARNIVIGLILVPYLSSFIVRAYGWMALLGAQSPVLKGLSSLGIQQDSLVGTFPGVLIAMTHMLLPLMIFPLFASMAAIDPRSRIAAMSLGASPAQAFARAFLPQTVSGIAAGSVLVFTATLGFFVVPALIGAGTQTTVAQLVYTQLTVLFNWETAASLAVILFVTVLAGYALCARVVPVSRILGVQSGGAAQKSRPPGPIRTALDAGLWRVTGMLPGQRRDLKLSYVGLGLALLILDLPFFMVLGISVQPHRLLALPTDGISFEWYQRVFASSQWLEAGWLSLRVGLAATLMALIVGYFAAVRVHRSARRYERRVFLVLCLAPIAVPVIVLAIGVFGVYIKLGWVGQFWAVAAAHAMLALPYVFVNVINGLMTYDESLDRAARSLGARPWQLLVWVRLPVLSSALASAGAFAFLVSFDELVLTLFLGGLDFKTLPVVMWAGANQGLSPELAVVGTLLIAVSLVLWLAVIRRRSTRVLANVQPAEGVA